MAAKKPDNPYYQGPVSDHFDGMRFFVPGGEAPGNLASLLKWQFREKRHKWPKSYPSPFHGTVPEPRVEGSRMVVTMIGHASLLIQTAGVNILTDPVWSNRVSPVQFAGPKRVNPPGVKLEDLPQIDILVVTHNHYDHMDSASLRTIIKAHDPLVVTPLGNDTIMRKFAPKARFAVMDWGDALETHGLRIHAEMSYHWSARGTGDRRMALWAAFVFDTPAGKIYHIGDTGFHDGSHYRAIAEKHGKIRLAILPIGAYEPRWFMKGQHQNPQEAVGGFKLCGAEYAVGHHWGTFQLTNEAIHHPVDHLCEALMEAAIEPARFRALRPGETAEIPSVGK
ncbi:MBL fold metallo-hydrolase [Rhizobium sp. L1K21]|uniref:MBL fold metallo-hydrolase n=1 Tax=Rhizobium sp. L1K21 TaxID=2954933 RepID=UPI002093D9E7|nr:MBL fold metallo-hydrolase [Rhizobium sp. L1K21]MCO6188118.1 MBL fold metallo-hydrolase [Rhizobium sp. L1K21]